MSDRPVPPSGPASPSDAVSRVEKKERLRRRLKAGVFTALLGLSWAASFGSARSADAAPARAELEQRIEQVRASLGAPADADPARADQPAQPWGNGWINWSNGWHNWHNAWNNWNNAWNNWSNHWHNWSNHWHNI